MFSHENSIYCRLRQIYFAQIKIYSRYKRQFDIKKDEFRLKFVFFDANNLRLFACLLDSNGNGNGHTMKRYSVSIIFKMTVARYPKISVQFKVGSRPQPFFRL